MRSQLNRPSRAVRRRAESIIAECYAIARTTQLGVQRTAEQRIERDGRAEQRVESVPVDMDLIPASDEFNGDWDGQGRLTGRGFRCLWSGEPTIREEARFIPGRDSAMKAALERVLKGEEGIEVIPREARWFLRVDVLCGFKIQNGLLRRV